MKEPDAAQFAKNAIGLFLDVDGTLLDLAPTPGAVEVSLALLDELSSLERRLGGAVALVSGRPIDDLDKLFSPLRLRASGVHGGEIRYQPGEQPQALVQGRLPDELWRKLQTAIAPFAGVFAENKGVSFAVHYRGAPASKAALRAELASLVGEARERDLELIAGHFVFEIKLAGFDKGRAIELFMARPPFAGRRPIFVADDRVDQPGFDKAIALGGLAYSVGAELPGVSGFFEQPQALREWLGRLGR